MSHHGSEMPDDISEYMTKQEMNPVEQKKPTVEELEKLMTQRAEQVTVLPSGEVRTGPGPTGKFPRGKIGPSDNGELAMIIGTDKEKGIVFVDFGTPVHWFALSALEVDGLCRMLQDQKKKLVKP